MKIEFEELGISIGDHEVGLFSGSVEVDDDGMVEAMTLTTYRREGGRWISDSVNIDRSTKGIAAVLFHGVSAAIRKRFADRIIGHLYPDMTTAEKRRAWGHLQRELV